MSRVLAVDWGTKRLGLAVSDPGRMIARPLPTEVVGSAGEATDRVVETAHREEALTVIIGLPLHASGAESASSRAARRLGDALRGRGLEVVFVDERWTSEDARELARDRGEPRGEKERVDQLAAVMLLQQYLDHPGAYERA